MQESNNAELGEFGEAEDLGQTIIMSLGAYRAALEKHVGNIAKQEEAAKEQPAQPANRNPLLEPFFNKLELQGMSQYTMAELLNYIDIFTPADFQAVINQIDVILDPKSKEGEYLMSVKGELQAIMNLKEK